MSAFRCPGIRGACWRSLGIVVVAIAGPAMSAQAGSATISLAGQWQFALDAKNEGVAGQWFARRLPGVIRLPGSVDEAGVATNTERPTLLRLYRPHKYAGVAWFQRPIDVPAEWKNRHVRLLLERCHWETQVWVDGRHMGMRDSLCVAHEYDLGQLSPGLHRLTIRVDNHLKYNLGWQSLGPDMLGLGSHMLSEDTQTNWNGIVGRIELAATPPVRIADLQVYPDLEKNLARVKLRISNATNRPVRGTVQLLVREVAGGALAKREEKFSAEGAETALTVELPVGTHVKPWDEFTPTLYQLAANLSAGGDAASSDSRTLRFGMRSFAARGTQLAVNGRPTFLRGTVNCAEFPRTGYPPTDVDAWRRIFQIAKSYGLNFMRFHSWCPPEAGFAAADQEGFYLLVEGPSWLGDVGKDPKRDLFLAREASRILVAYGNHPSFCLMTLGNEAAGDLMVFDRIIQQLMREDPRHLYSGHSGEFPTDDGKGEKREPSQQFRETSVVNTFPLTTTTRCPRESTEADYGQAVRSEPRPVVVHEIGAFDVFPNLAEMPKYAGVLKPRNFELVRDGLKATGLLHLAPRYVEATGRLAVELYKAEIETQLRTSGLGGFSLLELNDYPGQALGTVGILDAFWDSKGLITPERWRRFCSPVVPLLRFPKRVYSSAETFSATAELANYGPRDLPAVTATWRVLDDAGKRLAAGELPAIPATTGKVTALGRLEVPLAAISPLPARLRVCLTVKGANCENDWDLWVYPPKVDVAAAHDVVVSRNWDQSTRQSLAEGRRVLLFVQPGVYEKTLSSKYFDSHWGATFAVMFWNGKPGLATMGGLIQAHHPAFAHFPTDSYLTWQWKDLVERHGTVIRLEDTPAEFLPIWQVIDDFALNRKLGMLFEARVGRGRLLACGFNLWEELESRPAARQLLHSIQAYMDSPSFQPKESLDVATLDRIFVRAVKKGGASDFSGFRSLLHGITVSGPLILVETTR